MKHKSIWHPQNIEALRSEPIISLDVRADSFDCVVHFTVQLDDQAAFETNKISYERANWILTSEFLAA